MADRHLTESDALKEFWDHLESTRTIMLGINAVDKHSQPMTAFAEPELNLIWFFTRDDTEIVTEIGDGCEGRLTLASKDTKVHADITGALTTAHDPERVEKYWGPMVAAWYPEGKEDPHLILLRFAPVEGHVWASTQGVIRLAFEVTKANLTKTMPNIGGSADVNFRA
jgi:general stress protein 26